MKKKKKEKFETLISRAELRNNIFDLPIKKLKKCEKRLDHSEFHRKK